MTMHEAIKQMLIPYKCVTPEDYKNAFKEIIQEIALLGLARHGFFDHAAFYGGTALRIAHGLNRFSEDLDFTLLKSDPNFSLKTFLKGIQDELVVYDLKLIVEIKEKVEESDVESAFLKANTIEILLSIEGWEKQKIPLNKNDSIKIKLEIDRNPPIPSGNTETKFLTLPINFSYKVLNLSSLFAGKIHAVLCRKYRSGRVKGRDHYDFIWYINKGIMPDMDYLKAKLVQTGHWDQNQNLTLEELKKNLEKKFSEIDWEEAKKDVLPFIKDRFELNVWSKGFFLQKMDGWSRL
jgi:predicted nucleotidyltransferase component of viral defense system